MVNQKDDADDKVRKKKGIANQLHIYNTQCIYVVRTYSTNRAVAKQKKKMFFAFESTEGIIYTHNCIRPKHK